MEQNGRCRQMLGQHFPTCCQHVVWHVNVVLKLTTLTSDKPFSGIENLRIFTALAMISYLIQLRKIRPRRMSSRHSWHTYFLSIATIRSIVSWRRLWLMIIQKETERHFPAAAMQLLRSWMTLSHLSSRILLRWQPRAQHLPRSRKELEHQLPLPSAPIIRKALLTRNATPMVRRGTHQDVALRRKARLRRIRRTTSRSLVTSLPRQSSPWLRKSRTWRSWSVYYKLIKRIVMPTQVSPAWRETHIFNMHVQPLLLLILMWPWLSSPIRHGIWISGVCGSWIISLSLTYVATLILLTNGRMQKGRCTCQVKAVNFVSPRNVRFLVMIVGFGSLNRQWLIFFASRTWSACIGLHMILCSEQHLLCTKRNLVFLIWSLIYMHPCGLHVYYPKKIDGQYGFSQPVASNMKLFTKQQIEGLLKACHQYVTLSYPSNADFETVLKAGSIGGCTLTTDDTKLPTRFGAILSQGLRVVLSERLVNPSLRAWWKSLGS